MALSTLVVSQSYTADGSNTDFAIPVTMIESDSDEVKVYERDESTTPATVTLKTEGVHYNLVGRPDPDSFHTTVRYVTAPASGLKVFIERSLGLTQTYDPDVNGQVNLANIETGLDRLAALIQQLNFQLQRTLYFGRTSGKSGYELPDPEGDTVLGYNSAGTAIENKTIADMVNLAGSLAIANNLSDLSNVSQALINLGIAPLTVQADHDFTDGQSATNLTGETADGTVYTSVVYEYEVIRGTTIMSTGKLALHYKNSTWGVVDGGYEGNAHGLSFSVQQTGTSAQLRLAASSSGGGDGTIKLKKHYFKPA